MTFFMIPMEEDEHTYIGGQNHVKHVIYVKNVPHAKLIKPISMFAFIMAKYIRIL